jgi:hypothetical protein
MIKVDWLLELAIRPVIVLHPSQWELAKKLGYLKNKEIQIKARKLPSSTGGPIKGSTCERTVSARTLNRRDRKDYNAYQREYMRKRRAKPK